MTLRKTFTRLKTENQSAMKGNTVLVTLRQSMIRRELGALSAVTQAEIAKILCAILSA
jgi:hypothetical protein